MKTETVKENINKLNLHYLTLEIIRRGEFFFYKLNLIFSPPIFFFLN